MGTYSPQAKMALSLLKRKGRLLTFTRKVAGTLDPITQVETGGSTSTLKMYGLGLPPGKSAEYKIGSLEGRNVEEFHLAPNEGDVPQPGDVVSWKGADWTLFWVSDLDPVGEGSVYCQAYAER